MAIVEVELLARARKLKRDAVEAVLARFYPVVYRMAAALSGRVDVARGVVRYVMKRSPRAMPGWRADDDLGPQRWFHHHTILTTRRAAKHTPELHDDVFMADASALGPGYAAFIRALRSLPMQQREAFILNHGENLNARFLAVAMDCSVIAATQHLQAANNALLAIAGKDFEPFTHQVVERYKQLTPTEDLAVPHVKTIVRRWVWPRRIWAFLRLLIVLSVIGGAIFFWKKIVPMLEF
jgi:DNA-directed RNA polymerase specialized sigma24 family protein